jgi:hypothetical protein
MINHDDDKKYVPSSDEDDVDYNPFTTFAPEYNYTSGFFAVFNTPLERDREHRSQYGTWIRQNGGNVRCSCLDHFRQFKTLLTMCWNALEMPEVIEQCVLEYVDPKDYVRCLKLLASPKVDGNGLLAEITLSRMHVDLINSQISGGVYRLDPYNDIFNVHEKVIQVKIDLLKQQDTRGWTLLDVHALPYLKDRFRFLLDLLLDPHYNAGTSLKRKHDPGHVQQALLHQHVLNIATNAMEEIRKILLCVWSWRTVKPRGERHPLKLIAPVYEFMTDRHRFNHGKHWGVMTWEPETGPKQMTTITYYDTLGLIQDKGVKYLSWLNELYSIHGSAALRPDTYIDANMCLTVIRVTMKHALWSLAGKSLSKWDRLYENSKFKLLISIYLNTQTGTAIPLPPLPDYQLIVPDIVQEESTFATDSGVYCSTIMHLLVSPCSTMDRLCKYHGWELRKRLMFEYIKNVLYDPDLHGGIYRDPRQSPCRVDDDGDDDDDEVRFAALPNIREC